MFIDRKRWKWPLNPLPWNILLAAALFSIQIFSGFAQAGPAPTNCIWKLGATLPLTGRLAYQGVAVRRGLELGLEDINASGKSPCRLELKAEDNGGDPKAAVTNASKLFLHDKVDAILSDFTPMTQAVKHLAAREGKLLLYMATLPEIARENELFFMDYWLADDTARLLIDYLHRTSTTKAAFLTQQSEGCLTFQKYLESEAQKHNIQISPIETYLPGEIDLRPNLLRIKAGSPSMILTCTWADSSLLMRQLKELGMITISTVQMTAPFIPAGDTPEIRRLYEENRTVSSWFGYAEGSLEPAQRSFFERYRQRFGETPPADAFFAYDDATVFAAALNARSGCAADKCPDARVQAILNLDLQGLGGRLKFDRDGVARREQFLIQVRNGRWEKLQ